MTKRETMGAGRRRAPLAKTLFAAATLLTAAAFTGGDAAAQEPAACLSPDPAQWPQPSKPYFMLGADTSGSMTTSVGVASSCGFGSDRRAHLRCALKNTVTAFGGQANFGLATFPRNQTACGAACYASCTYSDYPNNNGISGCGPGSGATRRGAFIRVPMEQDSFWVVPPPPDNTSTLLSWVDNVCTSNIELFANGNTPLNGMLRDMKRYYSTTGWTAQDNSVTYPTPLASQDLPGTGVNGSTACRSVNVILITDGDETCDTQADAVAAAQDLYANGVVVGGKTFKIPVYVINFAGGNQANTNAIAAAGGTGTSVLANNETQLAQALANIVAGAVKPETCDNTDNNCNGCTDEGFTHYCNVKPAANCCAWANAAQRTACLNNYTASITPANPQGNLDLLPCTTALQQTQPANWLCFNPGELCDNQDNNCSAGVDEGVLKCGNPLHCPQAETCNNQDDDCDGTVDELVCGGCVPTPEVCDGCDNDCDGLVDEGIADVACGQASPANCAGVVSCPQKPNPGGVQGACPGGGFTACSNNPQAETCDGVDNDCDGVTDDNVPPTACVPNGTPPGLVYGGTSQCQMGSLPCNGACTGFVGPSAEVCDGVDNDCDGQVDEGVLGVGQPCGINQPPCTPGVTACVNGALVCQGGNPPQPEVCDGLDNDCDLQVDETPLADAPAAGNNFCWDDPGNCCVFDNLAWCPPAGGTCNGNGSLAPPCNKGTIQCAGAAGWACVGPTGPQPEACDGIDNDCDGTTDEASDIPQIGQPCGSDTGECVSGVLACSNNVLDCVGDTGPIQELCNGLDDDCDGVIDNGIVVGGPCTVPYDVNAYPGDHSFPPCQPGVLVCDGMGGQVCMGGVGPQPEVCDGIDNDCDGQIDEVGVAPNGINGSANPAPPPAAAIGDACGTDEGLCDPGTWGCENGIFVCKGGTAAAPEECDCNDNDCDGSIDNENPGGNPPLCGSGKSCVKTGTGTCQCAEPCATGEIQCPSGQTCETVTDSETGAVLGSYCVTDFGALCGDCGAKTVTDASGAVLCAPAGTELPGCVHPPVCVCKNQNGCQKPCFGVTCQPGSVCTDYGPNAGKCVEDNCYNVPCQGCGKVCNLGTCVDNPCVDGACPADQVCEPSADFTMFECKPSCADVSCQAGEVCKDGVCVADCPACSPGQTCDYSQDPPACTTDLCQPNPCTDGSCCDPLTGACGNCPCEGVVCPDGQTCQNGDCFSSGGSGGQGGGGQGGSAGGQGGQGNQGGQGGQGNQGGAPATGVWGLATGGGGCSMGARDDEPSLGWLAALAGLAGLARRRRR